MYIPGRSRTCSTPSRTWMSADSYCPGLLAAALLVAVLAKDPPSKTRARRTRDGASRGADGTSAETPTFYQPGVTPKAVSVALPAVPGGPKVLVLQAFPRVGPDDHADRGDA